MQEFADAMAATYTVGDIQVFFGGEHHHF